MIKQVKLIGAASLILLASCGPENDTDENVTITDSIAVSTTENTTYINDVHSYANINEVHTTHLHLDLEVDFDAQILIGSALHKIENTTEATEIIFDINGLEIEKVLLDDKSEASFELGDSDELLGRPLKVAINSTTTELTIFYKTKPSANALQWLAPQQTAGKKDPYLFTQGEAVLTRTWIPCQDTPGNRITYSANIAVPSQLMAVMSADNPTEKAADGSYAFEMQNPIPCYLIALAVGDLEFTSLGERTGVYSEPSMMEKSVYEFQEVEEMIVTAEGLYGPYKWGRYDIIVLPPSFPYGGMENPKLTFATPTILAGDRSLVSLIAHELAHSWSGNLVTNATWDDFWLNEGFTVYFENRIMEALYGKEHADMLFSIEYTELLNENNAILEGDNPEDTKLKLDLINRDPDDGMTAIAYVKGALFLKTLENKVGRDKFDGFINSYFKAHEFQTLTTEDFIVYLDNELLMPNDITFNTNEWIYEQGIPDNSVKVTSDRFAKVEEISAKVPSMESAASLGIDEDKWSTQEWMHFIRTIPAVTNVEEMKMLDEAFNFKACGNSEIMSEWYIQSIRLDYMAIESDMEKFLINVGRRKFLEPIYTELAKTPEGMEIAGRIYAKARPNYHSISYRTIDEILNWKS